MSSPVPFTGSAATLLPVALSCAVPLRIQEIIEQGDIHDEDIDRIQKHLPDLGAYGDELLYKSSKAGQTTERFNQLVDTIAVLSFCPGGITCFGLHFETGSQTQHPPLPSDQPPDRARGDEADDRAF